MFLERDRLKPDIGLDILPFEMGYLPDIYQKKAEVELGENSDIRVRCIQLLKEMLKCDKRTKEINFDESYLLSNLRARKFNVDRAYKNVFDLVLFSRKYSAVFTGYQFDVSVRAIREGIMTVLPWRCHEGCTVIIVQIGHWKPSTFSLDEFQRILIILILQSLRDPMTQVNGFKYIINVECSSLRYLKFCTPQNLIYRLYHGTQECAPARYKEIHIVNDSLLFKTAWFAVKPFLGEKMKKRIFFHSTPKTLLENFPRAILPTSYSGDLREYDQSNWLKKAMEPEQLAAMGGGIMRHLNGPI